MGTRIPFSLICTLFCSSHGYSNFAFPGLYPFSVQAMGTGMPFSLICTLFNASYGYRNIIFPGLYPFRHKPRAQGCLFPLTVPFSRQRQGTAGWIISAVPFVQKTSIYTNFSITFPENSSQYPSSYPRRTGYRAAPVRYGSLQWHWVPSPWRS